MAVNITDIYKKIKSITPEERDELFNLFYDDPQLRADLSDGFCNISKINTMTTN